MLLAGRVRGARPDAAARGQALIDQLGLREVAGSLPHQLSGGEQQRFAIARALVNDPDVLLADEPTGNLDVRAGAEVLRLLRAGAEEGRAVIMVTHETAAADIADRVLTLHDGLSAVIRDAIAGLRARRGRTLLAALGVLAASLVVGTAVTVGYSLATGFDRSATQADLPDIIARFPEQSRRQVDARVVRPPQPRGPLLPRRVPQRRPRRARPPDAQGRRDRGVAGPPGLRRDRGPRPARRPARRHRDRARPGARVGPARRRHAAHRQPPGPPRSSGSRSRRTTWRTRWRRRRGSTSPGRSCGSRPAAERRAAVAQRRRRRPTSR